MLPDHENKLAPQPENYGVFLPCNAEDFKEFVSGLLGEAQTISKTYFGQYELTHEKILGFHHLITQRIAQNRGSHLLATSVKIAYNDNSVVSFNSIKEFESYNEVKPLIPVAVHLNWKMLIHFPGKNVPEKQAIDISIVSNRYKNIPIYESKDIFRVAYSLGEGCISFRISHTLRSWGADIESLLSNHIESLIIDETKLRSLIREKADLLSLVASAVFMMLCVSIVIFFVYKLNYAQNNLIASFFGSSLQDINNKIDCLLKVVSDGIWVKFTLMSIIFLVVALILSGVVGFAVNYILEKRPPSFILLTEKSKQDMDKIKSRVTFRKIKFAIAIGLSFTINILAAVCYDNLIK